MITLMILLALALAAYRYGSRRQDYWRRRGVHHERPLPFLGTDPRAFLSLKSVSQMASETYRRHPGRRFVGLYRGNVPQLLLRDPDLVRDVMVTEFGSFHARGLHPCEARVEPLLRNLFFADGDLWRALRRRLTPAFTSARLRAMFPLIEELASKLQARVSAAVATARASELDARDLMACYTIDLIGSCGFGIQANSLDDDKSAFKKLGTKIFKMTLTRCVTVVLKCLFPELFKSMKFLGQEVEDEVFALVNLIRKTRGDAPSSRGDFVDLMIELTHKGKVSVESIESPDTEGGSAVSEIEIDAELVAAQCFIFFAAGFETSTTATSFTLHQLAHNRRVQERAQQEVDAVLRKHGGKLSYEAVQEMTYLEWVLMEGLRMFPPGLLLRKCTKSYTIPGTSVTIDRGVKILIPLEAIQNDSQYFHDPEQFLPERFSPENVAKRHKQVYLPFGTGPRYCIGARLGMMQSLAGLAAVLARFTLRPAPRTPAVLAAHPASTIVQNIEGPVPLLFYKREQI